MSETAMNQVPSDTDRSAELDALVREAIERVAPDVDATAIPADADFRDEAELDSMDFLGVLGVVHDRTGVEIPEADYGRITTIDELVAYLMG
jgi:acyl carrier protein